MSWGIWKKIKQGVAKVGGFVRNLLGGAPKVINNTMDTVNTLGKKAMRGVKRASKIVKQLRYDDDDESGDDDEEVSHRSYTDDDEVSSAKWSATAWPGDTLHRSPTPSPSKTKRQVPRWRKLLDKRNDDDEAANKYAVKYAGRSWVPKMKPKDQRRRLVIDDSEDLTE